MDQTKRGIVVLDIFGEEDDTGFGVISSESLPPDEPKERPKLVPMPELQIVPASPIVTPDLPSSLPPVAPKLPN